MINSNTYTEILNQPQSWLKEYRNIRNTENEIKEFFSKNNIGKNSLIIFTGAGTSAFIGNILTVIYARRGYKNCRSVATTDILTHPEEYLPKGENLVLVSFARSGDSPESLAVVELACAMCKTNNIIITCNQNGKLAKNICKNDLLLLLSPETNDKGLAMTNSFSTMLLTGALLADFDRITKLESEIEKLSINAATVLSDNSPLIKQIAKRDFKRAVFLGSGELKGVAEECHLKLQELTDGAVVCKFDTYLGFRHGPKAIINSETLIVYLLSNNDYVSKYEKDLIEQINSNNKLVAQIALSERKIDVPVKFDMEMIIGENEYSFVMYAFIGQLLGFHKSVQIGLNPDSPAVSGNIARVVQGVNIYKFAPNV